eukprot:UN05343
MSARKKTTKRTKQTHLYNTRSKALTLLVLLLLYMINVYNMQLQHQFQPHSSTAASITVTTSASGTAPVANHIPLTNPSVQPALNSSPIAAQQQQLLPNLLDDDNDEHADENTVEVVDEDYIDDLDVTVGYVALDNPTTPIPSPEFRRNISPAFVFPTNINNYHHHELSLLRHPMPHLL